MKKVLMKEKMNIDKPLTKIKIDENVEGAFFYNFTRHEKEI